MKRTALYYFFAVSAVGLGIFFILRAGNQLPAPALPLSPQSSSQITPHLSGAADYSFSVSVCFCCVVSGRVVALQSNWGLPVYVYRRYGNGHDGAAPQSAYSSRSQPCQHHCSLFFWRAAGVILVWPPRSTWGVISWLCP